MLNIKQSDIVKTDCKYYQGDVPCLFHKSKGSICDSCEYYRKIGLKILIIKLGASGDVIRTTPILHGIIERYPQAEIYWLTNYPELVPSVVNHVLVPSMENILWLTASRFGFLYNLDKDRLACSLTERINAVEKEGFTLKENRCYPINSKATHKWMAGLFDNLNSRNKKNYVEEIFEICGYEYKGQKYIIEISDDKIWKINGPRPLIGLNTGCGDRWKTRLWTEGYWVELAGLLRKNGYGVMLLGGEGEDEKNRRIAKKAKVKYLGHFPLRDFVSLINQTDLVVTAVTMALHVAIGLNKKVVLLNNIFNRNEFYLYGLGKIIEPPISCLGCFRRECDVNCMKSIKPKRVFEVVKKLTHFK